MGKIPGSFKSSSSYRWTDPRGNEVSPPSQYANMMNGDKSEMRLLGADDERKVGHDLELTKILQFHILKIIQKFF